MKQIIGLILIDPIIIILTILVSLKIQFSIQNSYEKGAGILIIAVQLFLVGVVLLINN